MKHNSEFSFDIYWSTLKNPKNQNFEKNETKLLQILFLRYKLQRTELFVVLGNFLPFDSPNNPKKSKFWKTKLPRDIIILHLCTTNENHMMYGSWDKEHDRQNFFSIWTILCPFTPLTTQKIKMKKMKKQKQKTTKKNKTNKKHLEILSFYTSMPNIMIICYNVHEI